MGLKIPLNGTECVPFSGGSTAEGIGTAPGVASANMWREIFANKPLPIVPGSTAVNIDEVNRALLDDTSVFQKRKMAMLQGRGPTTPPEPTPTLAKRWFGK